MAEETGLDSWFLHEKLVLSLLSKRDAIDLTRPDTLIGATKRAMTSLASSKASFRSLSVGTRQLHAAAVGRVC
ncbi:MAG: hypothetical protein ACREQ5_24825, partial [Candidatus Dormibacteria bacterium]